MLKLLAIYTLATAITGGALLQAALASLGA